MFGSLNSLRVKSQVGYIYRVSCATLQLHRLGAESKVLAPVLTSLDSRLLEVVPKLNARGRLGVCGAAPGVSGAERVAVGESARAFVSAGMV